MSNSLVFLGMRFDEFYTMFDEHEEVTTIFDECEEVIEEHWNNIVMQMKSTTVDYVSDNKLDEEGLGKKRKPYYRRGRWE